MIPPMTTITAVTKPGESDRPITALFRFSPGQHHNVPIPHFNHFIRKELLEVGCCSKINLHFHCELKMNIVASLFARCTKARIFQGGQWKQNRNGPPEMSGKSQSFV